MLKPGVSTNYGSPVPLAGVLSVIAIFSHNNRTASKLPTIGELPVAFFVKRGSCVIHSFALR